MAVGAVVMLDAELLSPQVRGRRGQPHRCPELSSQLPSAPFSLKNNCSYCVLALCKKPQLEREIT